MRGNAEASLWLAMLEVAFAFALALSIFALDILSPLQGGVAVLYTVVVLIAAQSNNRSLVFGTGTTGAVLTILGYAISHGEEPLGSPAMRLATSLVAILVITYMCGRKIAADDERRRSDERYGTLFHRAGVAMWESDWSTVFALLHSEGSPTDEHLLEAGAGTVVRNANEQAALLLGYTDRHDMIGRCMSEHFTIAGRNAQVQFYKMLMRGIDPVEGEVQIRKIGGKTVDLILRITAPPNQPNRNHVLISALDITERKRVQEQLEESRAELTHMARLTTLGQLAATIAHEVNQPLSAITTYARSGRRWLTQGETGAREADDCFDHIALNSGRATEVVARIRDLARKADPKRAPLAISQVIADTVALLQRELEASAITLTVDVSEHLPAVSADRVQLQQVLMNLLLNAQQAMSDLPEAQRELWIEGQPEGGGANVSVIDRGVGLAGIDPDTLFRPFFTTKRDGMGVGLFICRAIVEQHGGTLHASENAHGGATMQFWLPPAAEYERVGL